MKPFVKNLDKKLELIAKNQRKKLLKLAKETASEKARESYLKRSKNPLKDALELQWGPKRKTFKSSSGKLEFNPDTGVATSYSWYQIAAVIKGKLILNTFRYSVTTAQHVEQLKNLFKQLGLKHVSIEAPEGLQDMGAAIEEQAFIYAKAFTKNKYARIKDKKSVAKALNALKLCEKLGDEYITDLQLFTIFNIVEQSRAQKLEKLQLKRKAKKEQKQAAEVKKFTIIQGGSFLSH